MSPSDWLNKLYFGDNLDILRQYVRDESVDLIYLDPPFNSNASYNVLFKEKSGQQSTAQIHAFEDTWQWGLESERAFHEVVTQGPKKLADLLQAMRSFLGRNDMMAYLVMMAQRLVELHRVLKRAGSFYLHCDPTASHYIKLLMDAVFGVDNFRNEIVWQRTSAHNDPSKYGRVHDIIFFYTKSSDFTWNQRYERQDVRYFKSHDFEQDSDGRLYRKRDLTAPAHGTSSGQYEWKNRYPPSGRMWSYTRENMEKLEAEGRIVYTQSGMPRLKIYTEDLKGVPFQDVWARSELWLNSASGERLGYPTQKPQAVLERIIESSSNESDVVLDPFCGCGTAVAVAEKLHRRWIGIDITYLAINLMEHRLEDTFGKELLPYEVIGEPRDVASALELAHRDRYQFEWWALSLVDARPAQDKKKGSDSGIDGYINFFDDESGKAKSIVVQVKSGHVSSHYIRDLKGVVEREKAAIGVLVTLEEPTRPMLEEAVAAGFYIPEMFPDRQYQRIQGVTIAQLLDGAKIQFPAMAPLPTFARAARRDKQATGQQRLSMGH